MDADRRQQQQAADIAEWLGSDGSDLSALPRVAAELAVLSDDVGTACERLAEIVVREPVLAARMLRLVNSAYFGLSQKVTDIRHAVFLLGLRTVRTVALTAAVMNAFDRSGSRLFDLDRFWRHSIAAAAVCATLAKRCGTFDRETAFSLGLLHDIGKLLLVRYRPADVDRVVTLAREEEVSFREAEERLLPFAHPELGAWLGRRWGLPEVLVEGIARHHQPPSSGFSAVEAALRFADYLCAVKGVTASGSHGGAKIEAEAWRALGLASADLPPLIEVINAEIRTAETLLRES